MPIFHREGSFLVVGKMFLVRDHASIKYVHYVRKSSSVHFNIYNSYATPGFKALIRNIFRTGISDGNFGEQNSAVQCVRTLRMTPRGSYMIYLEIEFSSGWD